MPATSASAVGDCKDGLGVARAGDDPCHVPSIHMGLGEGSGLLMRGSYNWAARAGAEKVRSRSMIWLISGPFKNQVSIQAFLHALFSFRLENKRVESAVECRFWSQRQFLNASVSVLGRGGYWTGEDLDGFFYLYHSIHTQDNGSAFKAPLLHPAPPPPPINKPRDAGRLDGSASGKIPEPKATGRPVNDRLQPRP